MNLDIRKQQEQFEYIALSPYAMKAAESLGRDKDEEPCPIRTAFQRDRDRIVHSKSFRRLKDKTQVFLSPSGDHYRTRLTHTLEVSQIARTIGKALRLNNDLIEAIALGHDLGHTPFGHEGEAVLNEKCPLGFAHYKQSVRVVEKLEREGIGLNLTKEVREGILNHGTSARPKTLEAQVVRLSDKLAYIHHDMDDAQRAGIITEDIIPKEIKDAVGYTCKERLNTFVMDIVNNSLEKPVVSLTKENEEILYELRRLMFENVYTAGAAKKENPKVFRIISLLYDYYIEHIEELSGEFKDLLLQGEEKERVVCDYISGMTDQYAIHIFEGIYVPKGWEIY